MAYNQLFDFLDHLDTTIHTHLLMFYEEPEYARLVQFRFLKDGLTKGEGAMYIAMDEQDLLFTNNALTEYGIDVNNYAEKGLLQLYVNKGVSDLKEFKQMTATFFHDMKIKFINYDNKKKTTLRPPEFPKIRALAQSITGAFVENTGRKNESGRETIQLQIERYFHYESCPSFNGSWMCFYQLDDINSHMNKQWMADLLEIHDAVLYLPKLSNGFVLNLKKE
jgi:hypothetical protein